jgi:hypothetical protein
MIKSLIIAATALSAVATPALAQDRWDWSGGGAGDRTYRLVGAGVPRLYPELRATPRGRAFVMRNFDRNGDGRVSPREAADANAAFAQVAGPRRDGFDWDRRDRTVVVETREVVPGQWDRRAMHDYGFRQTARGATLTLSEDVLFATDSDVLRPGVRWRATCAPTAACGSRSTAIPTRAGPTRTTRTCPNAAPQACAPRSTRWVSPGRVSAWSAMARRTR